MKTVISKKLYAILPTDYVEVKLNGEIYHARVRVDLYDESNIDITLNDTGEKEFNYFCYNKNNKITCWPVKNGEQALNTSGQWKLEGRQEIKPGKFLFLLKEYARFYDSDRDRFDDELPICEKIFARLCEIFADIIKGSNETITFNTTKKIRKVYETQSHENSGYLLNSCMRIDSSYNCNQYSRFYDNIDDLQIVHKIVNNSLLFRALLWKAKDREGNTIPFLDRIYGSSVTENQLIEYAKEHGWAWRSFSNDDIYFQDKRIELCCKISQEAFKYLQDEGSPYVDSLRYLTKKDNTWWLSNFMQRDFLLQDCDGEAVPHLECRQCGGRINENESHSFKGGMYCDSCYDKLFAVCPVCSDIIRKNDLQTTIVDGIKTDICENCLETKHRCIECGKYFSEWLPDKLCPTCLSTALIARQKTIDASDYARHFQSNVRSNVNDLRRNAHYLLDELQYHNRSIVYNALMNANDIVNEQLYQLYECQ